MEDFIKKRKAIRMQFTKTVNSVTALLGADDLDLIEVQSLLSLAEKRGTELESLDNQIFTMMISNDSPEKEVQDELDQQDRYAKSLLNIKGKVSSIYKDRNEADSIATSSHKGQGYNSNYKLPKVELFKFGGEPKDWLSFWSLFQVIDKDTTIPTEQKFQYLLQSMIPGSRAQEIVKSFPPVAENYLKAIEELKNRFGREGLLVQVYVRELLGLVLKNASSAGRLDLPVFYDKLECQLRALETLGVTSEKSAAILLPLVESCLTDELLRAWQRSNIKRSDDTNKSDEEAMLEQLRTFIKLEVENEQRITLANEKFGLSKIVERRQIISNKSSAHKYEKEQHIPTAYGLVNADSSKCIFCELVHPSANCIRAQKLTMDQRRDLVNKAQACYRCLKIGHQARRCKSHVKCVVCSRSHVVLLCPEIVNRNFCKQEKYVKQSAPLGNAESQVTTSNSKVSLGMANYTSGHVFLQTLKVVLIGPNGGREVRALMDSGSQHSYILRSTVQYLGLEHHGTEHVAHALFGGLNTNLKPHKRYYVSVKETGGKPQTFEMLDENIICGTITPVFYGPWMEELNCLGIDIKDNGEGQIELLFGADVLGKIETGIRHRLNCGLVAIETCFGWTIIGKVEQNTPSFTLATTSISLLSKDASITQLWNLDTLNIKEPIDSKNDLTLATKEFFLSTTTTNEEGRYEVRLPWLDGHPPLPDNYTLAKKRLDTTLKKLENQELTADYNAVFLTWLQEGIIEEVSNEDSASLVHYLPHRPVVKEGSTTRIRPVFDASSHLKGQPCLNDCLEKGMNMIEQIPDILNRFRLKEFGVVADIAKAFLQISIHETDRDSLRFLWINEIGQEIKFRHKRVVFGVNSSPFLLGATVEYHLAQCMEKAIYGGTSYSKETIEILEKGFCVDNCVVS